MNAFTSISNNFNGSKGHNVEVLAVVNYINKLANAKKSPIKHGFGFNDEFESMIIFPLNKYSESR